MKKTLLVSLIAAACSNAHAIDPFTPLNAPATALNTNEATNPFLLPSGWTATKVTDRNTLNSQAGFQASFGNWDMVNIGGANHEFVYIPMEVGTGAGVVRYNRDTGISTTLMAGNNSGVFESNPAAWNPNNDDFGAFDPAVITPNNTLVVAEEWSGNGRIFEISNPETATGTGSTTVNWLSKVPSVSHEGIKFDTSGRMYFIDESKTGSIYRYTPKLAGDYSVGQTAVLKVDAHTATGGVVTENYDSAANAASTRTGAATWVDITDIDGNATTTADPFDFTNRGGRAAADEVEGTPFGRPEDLETTILGNGKEAIFFATTSENIVWSIELDADGNGNALVREFLNSNVTPDNIGNTPVGAGANDASYGLDDPDNLAIAFGPNGELQVFIIEDENPGDIFMAWDADRDGVAESVDLFASLGPFGSEPTGFILDPRGGFLVNIQHPGSGNDALWSIQQTSAVPVPAAVWLFGSGLAGLVGVARRRRA